MFNILKNIFNYGNSNVDIIIDDNKIPYFAGSELATLLEYGNPANAVSGNVDLVDKKLYSELSEFVLDERKNAQPTAVYINEAGMYSLIFGSPKDRAKEFKFWVLHTVLPKIRKYGRYEMDESSKEKMKNLNNQLADKKRRIKVLENNQKKPKFPDGGLVYALEPMGWTAGKKGFKTIRVGKSGSMKKRWDTYNSAVPDNFRLVCSISSDNPVAVEYCIRGGLQKYAYRVNKDYYVCKTTLLKKIFNDFSHYIDHGEFSEHESVDSLTGGNQSLFAEEIEYYEGLRWIGDEDGPSESDDIKKAVDSDDFGELDGSSDSDVIKKVVDRDDFGESYDIKKLVGGYDDLGNVVPNECDSMSDNEELLSEITTPSLSD